MKKTGQLLKDKREAANLSLSEVALATKINPKVLTAMENGDEASLPSKTFLKGFLRAYAVFLKMNPEEVLRSYQEESGQPAAEAKRPLEMQSAAPSTSRRPMKADNSAGLRTAAVIVIVLLIGVIIGVRELIEKYQRERQVEASAIKVSPLAQPPLVPEGTKPADSAEAKAAAGTTSTGTTSPTGVAPTGTADTVPTNPATVPAPDMKAQPAPAPAAAATPAPTEVTSNPPPPNPSTAVEPTKPEAPKVDVPKAVAAPKPDAAAKTEAAKSEDAKPEDTSKKSGKYEIILEALDKVEIKFQVKGETKKIALGPTQVHTIHADQPLTLDISDGGAVNVIVNGRERGVPGDLGKPKQLKVP